MTRYLSALLVLMLSCHDLLAASQDDFDEGVEYFKQKQYRQAIKAFTLSYEKGLKTPALFHNLGVSHYKLKNYPQAKKYFNLARQYPKQKMLAEYNLGLVAKKQNDEDLAKKHFTIVKQQSSDNKLVSLARIQLGEIKALEPEKNWTLFTKLSYGQDDNITTLPETTASKKSSDYRSIYVGGDLYLLGQKKSGIAVTGFYTRFDYNDYAQYDDEGIGIGIIGKTQTGSWANSLLLSTIKNSYGHVDYQEIIRFEAQTKTYLSSNNSLRFRYLHDDISSKNPTYNYLAGSRQRLRTELRNYGKHHYARFYYEHEQNDRANTAKSNFSATRNTLHAYYEYDLTPSLSLGARVNYRVSTYPAKVTAEREDKRQHAALRLSYQFNKTWQVRAQIEQIDNNSTTPFYTYQRQLTSMSLIADF